MKPAYVSMDRMPAWALLLLSMALPLLAYVIGLEAWEIYEGIDELRGSVFLSWLPAGPIISSSLSGSFCVLLSGFVGAKLLSETVLPRRPLAIFTRVVTAGSLLAVGLAYLVAVGVTLLAS